jgi:hypothetical protein
LLPLKLGDVPATAVAKVPLLERLEEGGRNSLGGMAKRCELAEKSALKKHWQGEV